MDPFYEPRYLELEDLNRYEQNATPVVRIARYVDNLLDYNVDEYTSDLRPSSTFAYGGKPDLVKAKAALDVCDRTLALDRNSMLNGLLFNSKPDGFLQLMVFDGTNFRLLKDDPQGYTVLPQLINRVKVDYQIQAVKRKLGTELSFKPTIVLKPIINVVRMQDPTIVGYYVCPAEFVRWERSKIAKAIPETFLQEPGGLSDPKAFISRFHNGEGRFVLPEELDSFDVNSIKAFWTLVAAFYDGMIPLLTLTSPTAEMRARTRMTKLDANEVREAEARTRRNAEAQRKQREQWRKEDEEEQMRRKREAEAAVLEESIRLAREQRRLEDEAFQAQMELQIVGSVTSMLVLGTVVYVGLLALNVALEK